MKNRFLFCTLLCLMCAGAQAQLLTYPVPQGVEQNRDFDVQVRQHGGEWKTVGVYNVQVDKVENARHTPENASMASFDFTGTIEVAVTYNRGLVDSARIRPLSYQIPHRVEGNKIFFELNCPRNLSVEVNGDIFHNLHLFANAMDANRPKKTKAKNLIYFGAGLHVLPNDTLQVPSGTTVYVAGGAVVRGCLCARNVRDVQILGHGIVRPQGRGCGIEIANSRHILVDGLCTSQCPVGGSDSVTVRNVKAITHYGWGDGLNIFASSNVLFDGVFCRTSDDCTTVYATRKGYVGSCRNIIMQNATLWADVAHPIMIGLHGNVPQPDVIENLIYRNIDILDHSEQQIDYQGCMAINAGDNNWVRNVLFEDIRVEDFRRGQLVDLRICYNKKYCLAPGLGIENVLFRNVSYTGRHAELSIIAGYDDERKVKNVRFENLTINGDTIYDDMAGKPKWYKTADMARFFVGEHVDNVQFVKN